MKLHIGVDSRTGLVHSARVTVANEHDKHSIPELLHGEERRVLLGHRDRFLGAIPWPLIEGVGPILSSTGWWDKEDANAADSSEVPFLSKCMENKKKRFPAVFPAAFQPSDPSCLSRPLPWQSVEEHAMTTAVRSGTSSLWDMLDGMCRGAVRRA